MHAALVQLLMVAEGAAAQAQSQGGLAEFYEKVGWPFFVNVAVIVVCLATILERIIYLTTKFRVNSRELLNQVKKLVQAGNIDRAIKLCQADEVPMLQMFRAGLVNVNRGDEAVVVAVEEQISDIEPAVKKRIDWLWSLANIGTLFGLLGTILGLIHTFAALDRISDPGLRTQALARGIAEAMLNTALGLGIALGCMIAHLILNNQAKKIIHDVSSTSQKLINLLTTQRAQG